MLNVSKLDISLVSQRSRSVVINYEQVYQEMNDFCISIILFYKSKFIRAEKNSELSKTSKMKVLEKIVKIFKNTIFAITFLFDV